ncbi:hypothetical protein EIN_400250 [Entamoeba invadens IP1]|uniref:Uncharacterized protein n=1 Tax=Entamoeba invadens IP1 TaxID=370355 RepID=A0A0A1UAD5_ENTIV|nr:hypothetical protein EIN_400250 [Entamoeba invadens IP1]ELP91945.1 hypothetical protein EIN_400250 [Entamoeba invadens IP1]|eukprot:XP_004258716.1 hypothetical protein EIN_400250 [Entamoeba invadens IP1]
MSVTERQQLLEAKPIIVTYDFTAKPFTHKRRSKDETPRLKLIDFSTLETPINKDLDIPLTTKSAGLPNMNRRINSFALKEDVRNCPIFIPQTHHNNLTKIEHPRFPQFAENNGKFQGKKTNPDFPHFEELLMEKKKEEKSEGFPQITENRLDIFKVLGKKECERPTHAASAEPKCSLFLQNEKVKFEKIDFSRAALKNLKFVPKRKTKESEEKSSQVAESKEAVEKQDRETKNDKTTKVKIHKTQVEIKTIVTYQDEKNLNEEKKMSGDNNNMIEMNENHQKEKDTNSEEQDVKKISDDEWNEVPSKKKKKTTKKVKKVSKKNKKEKITKPEREEMSRSQKENVIEKEIKNDIRTEEDSDKTPLILSKKDNTSQDHHSQSDKTQEENQQDFEDFLVRKEALLTPPVHGTLYKRSFIDAPKRGYTTSGTTVKPIEVRANKFVDLLVEEPEDVQEELEEAYVPRFRVTEGEQAPIEDNLINEKVSKDNTKSLSIVEDICEPTHSKSENNELAIPCSVKSITPRLPHHVYSIDEMKELRFHKIRSRDSVYEIFQRFLIKKEKKEEKLINVDQSKAMYRQWFNQLTELTIDKVSSQMALQMRSKDDVETMLSILFKNAINERRYVQLYVKFFVKVRNAMLVVDTKKDLAIDMIKFLLGKAENQFTHPPTVRMPSENETDIERIEREDANAVDEFEYLGTVFLVSYLYTEGTVIADLVLQCLHSLSNIKGRLPTKAFTTLIKETCDKLVNEKVDMTDVLNTIKKMQAVDGISKFEQIVLENSKDQIIKAVNIGKDIEDSANCSFTQKRKNGIKHRDHTKKFSFQKA